jgi:myo-inositol-1(or 4)-monophosphatase
MTAAIEVSGFGADATAAIAAASSAGLLARGAFTGPLGGATGRLPSRRNGRHDVVTRIDRAAERLIASILSRSFPADGFLGEETSPRDFTGRGMSRTWLVDPIDGTVDFVSGIPFFSISIALAIGTRITVGVVHDPIHGETFVAERGGGAWLLRDGANPEAAVRLRVRRLSAAVDAVVAGDPGDPEDIEAVARIDQVRARSRVVRTLGSTALSLAYLAAGRVDGVLQVRGLQAVDIAAGGLLALEAGALVTDALGGRWLDVSHPAHGSGIAAGGRAVHRYLLGDRESQARQISAASSK